MSERKLCMNCKHFNPYTEPPRCVKAIVEKDDLLFGKRLEPSGETAAQMRSDDGKCGPNAVLFMPRQSPQQASHFIAGVKPVDDEGKRLARERLAFGPAPEEEDVKPRLWRLRRLIFG